MRSLRNRFLRSIYLVADTRLKQMMFQFALVSCFPFCMLQTLTALSSAHVINSITNFPSNALNMQRKYSQPAKLHNTLYHCIFYLSKHLVCTKGKTLKVTMSTTLDIFQREIWFQNQYPLIRIKAESPWRTFLTLEMISNLEELDTKSKRTLIFK